jgi:hypothetical protein
MSRAREVDALFARLSGDQPFRFTLIMADDESRRRLIRGAGFGPYRLEDVRAEVSAVLESGHLPGLPASASWTPPPGLTWSDAPMPVMLARRSALVFGALAAAASSDPDDRWPPSPVTLNYTIVGAVKGGTTALDHFLSQHPDVCTAVQKETHFFVRDIFFQSPAPRYEWLHFSFCHYRGEKAVGEATPEYMYFDVALARMRDYNPALKLVFLLRHPAERAYSQYRMAVERGLEARSFSEALRQDAAAEDGADGDYTAGGFYMAPIRDVSRHFPRQQLLFLRSEELRQHHHETMTTVLEFLGVDPSPIPEPRQLLKGSGPPMAAADRRLLVDMYRAEVGALEDFFGWDLATWRC